jgi:hypothetical protein
MHALQKPQRVPDQVRFNAGIAFFRFFQMEHDYQLCCRRIQRLDGNAVFGQGTTTFFQTFCIEINAVVVVVFLKVHADARKE